MVFPVLLLAEKVGALVWFRPLKKVRVAGRYAYDMAFLVLDTRTLPVGERFEALSHWIPLAVAMGF